LRVEKDDVVGKIVRNQQLLSSLLVHYGKSRGVWNGRSGRHFPQAPRNFVSGRKRLQGNFDEPFRSDFPLAERVHRDPVPSIVLLSSGGIGDGRHRGIEMLAVSAERQS